MENLLLVIIKSIAIGFAWFIFFFKLLDKKVGAWKKISVFFVFIPLFTAANTALSLVMEEPYRSLLSVIFFSVAFSVILRLKYKYTLILITSSCTIGLLLFMFCAIIASIIYAFDLNYGINEVYINAVLLVITSFFVSVSKIRMSIKESSRFSSIAFLFLGVILSVYSVLREDDPQRQYYFLFVLIVIPMMYFLFSILRKQSATTLYEMNQQSQINKIISELNSLSGSHDFLEALVHKEKKSINSIIDILKVVTDETTDPKVKKKLRNLLNSLLEERKALASETEEYHNASAYELTGIQLLDAMVLHMGMRCNSQGIEFEVKFSVPPDAVLKFMNEDQLTSLIADLLENAIIASEHRPNIDKRISLAICDEPDSVLKIITKDNGIPFTAEVLESVGKQKITTHRDTGGTGNGLKNMCKLMRKTKASLEIEQFSPGSCDYTKAIVFKFDGKCEYTHNQV